MDLVDAIEFACIIWMIWMFFFERYMKNLKIYLKKRPHPEGCMVGRYELNKVFLFLCEFLSMNLEDGPHIWVEEQALVIIHGEQSQSIDVHLEISK